MAGARAAGHHLGMLSASPLTIRPANGDDAAALRRLAVLDDGREPAGRVLVAEEDGQLVAAMSVDDGNVVADPFEPTAAAVALLKARAAALRGLAPRPSWRERISARLRAPRLGHAAVA
jgi:hypothetical protein